MKNDHKKEKNDHKVTTSLPQSSHKVTIKLPNRPKATKDTIVKLQYFHNESAGIRLLASTGGM